MSNLERQILDYSYNNKLSHIGSCLTALPIIEEIYRLKSPDEKFILSAGHSHLAHAVVMASQNPGHPIDEYMKAGIHCDLENGCDVSTGSLGQGIIISIGIALADRQKDVYVLVSDGEVQEGAFFEALRVAKEQKLNNLKIYVNCNGYGAYKSIDTDELEKQISGFGFPVKIFRTDSDFGEIKGLDAHYKTLNEDDYKKATRQLKIR